MDHLHPYLVIDGEVCEITKEWLKKQTRRQVFYLVIGTHGWLCGKSEEDGAYAALWATGVLEEIDRAQDTIELRRLIEGLRILEEMWPVTVAHARDVTDKALRIHRAQ